ncbi:ABC transporter ATP-binding protein [Rhodococcus sp. T7]|uniref:ABC transporter ATP-binding protein n=1 Tax=Rhodococcus sp. T7 TaxID=627444 RepID=UPI00135C9FF5|nr:ABC transporter ATP-binding protein [Rhodococcus sp. T7]KAF0957811.1 High-affinity branched-chain amino acid transport ATP-binding protein LivF [Rhodococcus sp. T7]KAF0961536.1 High-affinity branched-chain amino acid transport ATP-binding protein LivF [Rhodococcus sp. T7]
MSAPADNAIPATSRPEDQILVVDGLTTGYGRLRVLHEVSLTVAKNEVVGILGANGAGKTTLLRSIAGAIRPTDGTVMLLGKDVTGQPDHVLTRAGVGHVPSGRELFSDLSVEANLAMGGYALPRARAAELRSQVLDLFPTLARMLDRRAGALSGGEQQMVAFGRALMTDPSLLLLDEPSTGLAPAIVASLFEALRQLITNSTMSVVLVEQNAALALEVVQRAYVLRQGRIVLDGSANELKGETIVAAYLGA